MNFKREKRLKIDSKENPVLPCHTEHTPTSHQLQRKGYKSMMESMKKGSGSASSA